MGGTPASDSSFIIQYSFNKKNRRALCPTVIKDNKVEIACIHSSCQF